MKGASGTTVEDPSTSRKNMKGVSGTTVKDPSTSRRNMQVVTCVLMGGLGNQLFQIFVTLAFAVRTHRKPIFPYMKKLCVGIERNTYWNTLFSAIKSKTTKNESNGYTNQQLASFNVVFKEESDLRYVEIPDVKQFDEILLYGYFQSPRYFENEKAAVFTLIGIPELKDANATEFAHYFDDNTITVSMHFRLGDYKYNQDYHPVLPYEYYASSLMHMLTNSRLYQKVRVLYFCEKEDNATVEESIKKLSALFYDFSFIKVDDTIPDWKQMLIMSNCHHNIIANSTFSWWGAYMNFYSNKTVYYPSLWFGPAAKYDNSAMFPDDWTKIDCAKN